MVNVGVVVTVFVVGFFSGYWLDKLAPVFIGKQSTPKPAYLIAAWHTKEPEALGPFSDLVLPLAQKAGYQMLAIQPPVLLEGRWPYSGKLIVQQYDSMQALEAFWNSPSHAKAKQLRAGKVDSHFVLAVEAL